MNLHLNFITALTFLTATSAFLELAAAENASRIEFVQDKKQLAVIIDGLPIAVYTFDDPKISRPYFAHVRAPGGVQVTRNHPPVAGQDIMDHDTYHPGIWMAFGDISGADDWRLKAPVRHAKFIDAPKGGDNQASFAVRNEYLDGTASKIICREDARYTFAVRPAGYLLLWDSTFFGDREFTFGDQEEMGLGFRIATPLRVGKTGKEDVPAGNGEMVDAQGRRDEEGIAGNAAEWCDFSGTMDGQRVGMTIFCHPKNFRASWYHARDYGLLVANAFAQEALAKSGKCNVLVDPGEKLRLRYGILIHAGPPDVRPNFAAAYQDYLKLAED
jgi:hypothetical protein